MFTKKAIHPIVAVVLLTTLGVVTAISFQVWFNNYYSSITGDIEDRDTTDYVIRGDRLSGNYLYVYSGRNDYVTNFRIKDENGTVMCQFEDVSPSIFTNKSRVIFDLDTDLNDTSYFDNDASIINDVDCTVTGISGKGCYFDGIDDEIRINADSSINLTDEVTISLWFNTHNDSVQFLASKYTWWGPLLVYLQTGPLRARFTLGENSSSISTVETSTTLANDTWYHLVATGKSNDSMYLYLNGVLEDSQISSVVPIGDHGTQNLRIGGSNDFMGYIDEIAIYSEMLSTEEVKTLYEKKKAKYYEQVLPDGVKTYDITNCNLVDNRRYEVMIFTENNRLEQYMIKK